MNRNIFSFIVYNNNVISNLKPLCIIIVINLITNKESIYSTIKRTISNNIIYVNFWNTFFNTMFKTCRTCIKIPSFKRNMNFIIIQINSITFSYYNYQLTFIVVSITTSNLSTVIFPICRNFIRFAIIRFTINSSFIFISRISKYHNFFITWNYTNYVFTRMIRSI